MNQELSKCCGYPKVLSKIFFQCGKCGTPFEPQEKAGQDYITLPIKCVCGEQEIIGHTDVEVGGICHREKNPCYHLSSQDSSDWEKKVRELIELHINGETTRKQFGDDLRPLIRNLIEKERGVAEAQENFKCREEMKKLRTETIKECIEKLTSHLEDIGTDRCNCDSIYEMIVKDITKIKENK